MYIKSWEIWIKLTWSTRVESKIILTSGKKILLNCNIKWQHFIYLFKISNILLKEKHHNSQTLQFTTWNFDEKLFNWSIQETSKWKANKYNTTKDKCDKNDTCQEYRLNNHHSVVQWLEMNSRSIFYTVCPKFDS